MDRIVSVIGLGLSIFLFVAAGLLNWGYSFADQNVTDQLAAQNIMIPAADSDSFKALSSEVSGAALAASAASKADPANTELASSAATLMGQRQTLFMGETLKGLLGNAYAFWQLGQIAMYAAWAAVAGGAIMLILALLGFLHLRRTPESVTV